jgi:hypothetical protein
MIRVDPEALINKLAVKIPGAGGSGKIGHIHHPDETGIHIDTEMSALDNTHR